MTKRKFLDPQSDEDETLAAAYMDHAFAILQETLRKSGLHIWRGQQKPYQDSSYRVDTIIVSKEAVTWTDEKPDDGYLLRTSRDGIGADIDILIGTWFHGNMTSFGDGNNPIVNLRSAALQVSNLELATNGVQFGQLLRNKLWDLDVAATTDTIAFEIDGRVFIRCDIQRPTEEDMCTCAAFCINDEGRVAAWTIGESERQPNWHNINFGDVFEKDGPNTWLDDLILSDTMLTVLTK